MPVRLVAALALLAAGTLLATGPVSARQPRPISLIVTGGIVVTMDAGFRVLSPGAVAVDGTTIAAVGTPAAIAEAYTAKETIDAAGHVVMPGLINTHTHAPMVMYRGLADDLALMDWLQKYIFPAEARTLTPAFVRVGAALAVLEMIQSGTTTYADMYYFEEEIARVTRAAGMRGVLGQTIIEFPVADAKTPADALARTEAFLQEFARDPLITPAIAPHSMYTLDATSLLRARDLAIKYGAPILIHVAETEDEVRMSRGRFGRSPVGYLDSLRFWGPHIVAAHGVWVEPDEIALLQRHNVAISHNPESNMKLASGTAPVPAYLASGIAIGLGTDGAASNNDLDMFEAMRQAAFLHKLVSKDPQAVSARAALEMATIGGARVLGKQASLGSLETGKLADLIVVRMNRARHTPMYDPVSHLVYVTRGDDVASVVVNGQVLMRDGRMQTLDEPAILAAARAAADEVRKAVTP
ncbi:MAG: amidohydrolase [Vicinamibacterales bacterium]|nr:amidohydrolase [Vicinamibacterales bacterium]